MSTSAAEHALWVAYGESGVTGTIRKESDGQYLVTMAGASEALGTFPSMEVAKNALHSHMRPGSDWPEFREH